MFVSSVHYLLSGFHVDVIVFILRSFNVLLIRASQLPVACLLYSFSSFSCCFATFQPVLLSNFIHTSSTLRRASISRGFRPYCRFPSSWIVFSAFCCVFWLDSCFVYGTMSPSDILAHCSDRPAAPAADVCARLRELGIWAPRRPVRFAHAVCVVRRLGSALVVALIPSV
jgi:hypothetical protein